MAAVITHGAFLLSFKGGVYSISDGSVDIDFLDLERTQLGGENIFSAKKRPNKMTITIYRAANFSYDDFVNCVGELISVRGEDGKTYQLDSATWTKSDGSMSVSSGEFEMEFSGPTGSGQIY